LAAQRSKSTPAKIGRCHLVGAGPGDPGLVTLRARALIADADVIIHDYLANPRLLAWSKPGAELIYAGKRAGQHTLTQDEINALLVDKTKAGLDVVRLKGGDPFVFGRGGEEALALQQAGLAWDVVPGITSAIAGPAAAGIPVTHRGLAASFVVATGNEDPNKPEPDLDFAAIARSPGTKVFLMGVDRIGSIAERLIAEGMPPKTSVALVRWATLSAQQTLVATIETVAAEVDKVSFQPPAVTIVGDVVNLRETLRWFENRPLFGKRIVVTRTREHAGILSEQLEALGADVDELPTIRIEPPKDILEFGELVRDAHTYNWIVFTSPNGVRSFFDLFFKIYSDARDLGSCRIAAVGPATADEVRKYRFAVDVQPKEYVAEAILDALLEVESVENLTFLLPRADIARDTLPKELVKRGAIVDEVVAYRTVPETEDVTGAKVRLADQGADYVTFTSASTAEHFAALGIPLKPGCRTVSIGPVTSEALREKGLPVSIEAKQHDIPGLVEAILHDVFRA
jgi:uroporphyrinogen III methyltransferase/synthase